MKVIKLIIATMILSVCSSAQAVIIPLIGAGKNSAEQGHFEWMNVAIDNMASVITACIYAPQFSGLNQESAALNLDNSGKWVPIGVHVSKDKLLQMEWSSKGVLPSPEKYKVLYRIDPRFEEPQVFIQKYNYETNTYISDFHQFKDGVLLRYQDVPEMDFNARIQDFTDYFEFNGRPRIPVKKNDVINITIDHTGSYFGGNSEMNSELGSSSESFLTNSLLVMDTRSPIADNRIIYSSAERFCIDGIGSNAYNCTAAVGANSFYSGSLDSVSSLFGVPDNWPNNQYYWDAGKNWDTFKGKMFNLAFDSNKANLTSCSDSASGYDNNPLCYYDKGRGMQLTVGGTTIKGVTEKFINSPFTGKDFFYHKSDTDGDLDFKTSWSIAGMYNNLNPGHLLKYWLRPQSLYTLATDASVPNSIKPYLTMDFLHFGRYLLDIEIGNSAAIVKKEDLDAIKVEYLIVDGPAPDDSTSGLALDRYYRGNASDTGWLYVRVINPNNYLTGTIRVNTTNYEGSTWFSDLVYGKLVKPLREKFNELSQLIYIKFISNTTLQNIARTMLVLYIIIYGLMFLAGATQITVTDIVTRVLKIGVILTLFSETSWNFFSNNLFNVFVDGTDSLLTSVVGVTSKDGNIFGFIDPIFDKYTNGDIWFLLFIQLLQIHTGLTFFAIITIYAILIYFKAILEVIVSYCLAFLGLAVMISLAPFFIILILFERTKSMFDNWISTMFSYMIQPTILLMFFLLLDQIMGDHIARTVVAACWDTLIPIKISIDLSHLSIPISFSFTLPFFPGLPFYVSDVASINGINDYYTKEGTFAIIATSSLLFYALAKVAKGLVDYATLVVQYLTNVLAARQSGKLQKGLNPIKDITSDMSKLASPVTGTASKLGRFAKEKLIDQKISHRKRTDSGNVDYSKFNQGKEVKQSSSTTQREEDGLRSSQAFTKPGGRLSSVVDSLRSDSAEARDSSRTQSKDKAPASNIAESTRRKPDAFGLENNQQSEKEALQQAIGEQSNEAGAGQKPDTNAFSRKPNTTEATSNQEDLDLGQDLSSQNTQQDPTQRKDTIENASSNDATDENQSTTAPDDIDQTGTNEGSGFSNTENENQDAMTSDNNDLSGQQEAQNKQEKALGDEEVNNQTQPQEKEQNSSQDNGKVERRDSKKLKGEDL